MQVALPIFTALLGGAAGFGFVRLDKALDRRHERLDADAVARDAAERERAARLARRLPGLTVGMLSGGGFRLGNASMKAATGISVTFNGYPREEVKGLPDEPFALGAGETVDFRLPGIGELPDAPQMWVKCAEYAEPVYMGFLEETL
jgi:hypothetical protein